MKTLFEGKKLYAIIIAFLFVITFFITFHIVNNHYKHIIKGEIAENKLTANLLSSLINEHQQATVSILVSHAQRSSFINAVKKKDFNNAIPHLKSLSKHYIEIDVPFLADPYGTLWANYPLDKTGFGKNLAYRDWYKGVGRNWKPYISTIFRPVVQGKGLTVAVSVPVFDRKGKVIGILSTAQRTAFFVPFVKGNIIDPKKNITLLDQEGNIIFSNAVPYEENITKYPDVRVREKAVAGVFIDMETADVKDKGSISYVSIAPVKGIGWSVIVEKEKDAIPKELYGYFILSAVTGFIIFLFLTVSLLYFRREYKYRKTKELLQAEERYRGIFENALEGIYQTTPEGQYLNVNPAFVRIFGFASKEEMMSQVTDIGEQLYVNPADRDRLKAALTDPGYVVGFEVEVRRKDGSTLWISINAHAVRDGAGRILYYEGTNMDITEHKKAEKALSQEKEKAQRYLDIVGAIVVAIDANQKVSLINQAGCKLLGYTEKEIIGENWFDTFIPLLTRDNIKEVFAKLIRGDAAPVEYFENSVLARSGEERIILWHNTVLRDDKGNVTGILSSGEDITERRQAEEKIRKLNVELEQRVRDRTVQLEAANKELEAFSYSVSHDLRAPLRSIDGFSRIILEDYGDKIDDILKNYLERLCKGAQHMGLLIDDLLKLSQVTRSEFHYESIDLSGMVGEIVETLRQDNPERTVDVVIQEGINVKGDPYLIKIAMENLLNNAWKFTGKGAHPRVVFGVTIKDGETIYFIKDNGAGFDMTYAGKLFGAFQRLHTIEEFPGTGVGLATVRRIINRHGGRIWAEGEAGKGATFWFTLQSVSRIS